MAGGLLSLGRRAVRALGRGLVAWADESDERSGGARAPDSPARDARPSAFAHSGPPRDWVERVARHAPHLLPPELRDDGFAEGVPDEDARVAGAVPDPTVPSAVRWRGRLDDESAHRAPAGSADTPGRVRDPSPARPPTTAPADPDTPAGRVGSSRREQAKSSRGEEGGNAEATRRAIARSDDGTGWRAERIDDRAEGASDHVRRGDRIHRDRTDDPRDTMPRTGADASRAGSTPDRPVPQLRSSTARRPINPRAGSPELAGDAAPRARSTDPGTEVRGADGAVGARRAERTTPEPAASLSLRAEVHRARNASPEPALPWPDLLAWDADETLADELDRANVRARRRTDGCRVRAEQLGEPRHFAETGWGGD